MAAWDVMRRLVGKARAGQAWEGRSDRAGPGGHGRASRFGEVRAGRPGAR